MTRVDVVIAGFSIAGTAAALALSGRLRVAIFGPDAEWPLRAMSRVGPTPLNDAPMEGHEFDRMARSLLEARGVILGASFMDAVGYDPAAREYRYSPGLGGEPHVASRLVTATGGTTPDLPPRLVAASGLWGRGLSLCAWSDGACYKGRPVAVLGAGHYALDQARILRSFGCRVTVVEEAEYPDRFRPAPPSAFEGLGASYLRVRRVEAVEGGGEPGVVRVRCGGALEVACEAAFYAPDLVPAWPGRVVADGLSDGDAMPAGVEAGVPYFEHRRLYESGVRAAERLSGIAR